MIAIDDSKTAETSSAVVTGMEVERGYLSPYLATTSKDIELNNPSIIITDETISNLAPILPILDKHIKDGDKEFLIIAENVVDQALNNLIINQAQGAIKVAAIRCPGFADNRGELLEDIAVLTGGTVMSERTGTPLSSITEQNLGHAKKIVVTDKKTTILDGSGTKDAINKRVAFIKQVETSSDYDKKKLQERVASLAGGIAVISVGAPSDAERDYIRMKVDDAKHSAQLAYKEGVVPSCATEYASLAPKNEALAAALQYPSHVLQNSGVNKFTNTDATAVVVTSLESAVSVAKSLILCGGIIAPKIDKKEDE